MDIFRTVVEVQPSEKRITYRSALLLMGSCFSDYIGEKLSELKFPVNHNPFGTLFNPASVSDNIRILMENKPFTADRLKFHNGQWISFNHYTGFSHPDKEICLERINNSIAEASAMLRESRFLFLTFGTAWIYRYSETGNTVANCHKIPASAFSRHLLSPEEIISNYDKLLHEVKVFNADLTVVFTLSPVRHWKDGAVDNQKSKSILHYAISKITELHPAVQYFPAYEIFMDELRDYRFYASDMLHPSESGIGYLWKRFTDAYIDAESLPLMKEIQGLVKAAGHRPVNPQDPAFEDFRQSAVKAITRLSARYPFLDFSPEIEALTR